MLWQSLLNEYLRELTYMASLAGIDFGTGLALEYISGSVYGYNDGLAHFIKELLHHIQDFHVSRNLFNDMKEGKVRAYQNQLKVEPYMLLDQHLHCITLNYNFSYEELLCALENEISYEHFIKLKNDWLSNMKIEWLIMGHLTKQEAVRIVAESEIALKYKRINDEHEPIIRMLQLKDNSVYDYERVNEDASNPNSAVLTSFQHEIRTYEKWAINSVLFHLIKEPFFNKLRTQEQLGYIVSSNAFLLKSVMHGKFLV